MAKKIETTVYPEAPLAITRERFCDLLSEQIEKGNELKGITVPQQTNVNPYYGGLMSTQSPQGRVHYDETALNDFEAQYSRWNDRNKSIYRTSFSIGNNIYLHEYESHIYPVFMGFDVVKDYKDQIARLTNHMQSDIGRSDLMLVDDSLSSGTGGKDDKATQVLSNDIFIVHGHSEEMKQTVARVITKLGLNPIILHEQTNGGKTIIEKFETNAANIKFAVILLSADDLAASAKELESVKDDEIRQRLEHRSRENVVFEMGYFIGKLDRSNVFLLLQNGVSKPGDLDGIVYNPYEAAGTWKLSLVKELKNVGYDVSADMLL